MTQARQFQLFIVRPALKQLGERFCGLAAEKLVVGTMLTESLGDYVDQITGPHDEILGPAVGLWQMEQETHDDIWNEYLSYRSELSGRVHSLLAPEPSPFEQLAGNLFYGAAMCRLKYYRAPEALPSGDNLRELAEYWKEFYNTHEGKGTIAQFCMKAKDITELGE